MARGIDNRFGHPGTLNIVKFILTLKVLDKRWGLDGLGYQELSSGLNLETHQLADHRLSAVGMMYLPLSIEEFGRRRSFNGLTKIIFLPGKGGREISYVGS
jgi:hypothetical protein